MDVGFDGNVRCPSLADLVQLECLSGARAALEVTSGARYGQLFFEQGELVHAMTDRASGEAAALEILGWKTGHFGDADAVWPARRTIQLPWQELLLRAAQISDERAVAPSQDLARSTSRLVAVGGASRPAVFPSRMPPAPSAGATRGDCASATSAVTKNSGVTRRRESGRAARLDAHGHLLAGHGEPLDEFVDLAAYLHRLVTLIGDDLALGEFCELVWDRASSRVVVQAEQGGAYVALEAAKGADVAALRRQLED